MPRPARYLPRNPTRYPIVNRPDHELYSDDAIRDGWAQWDRIVADRDRDRNPTRR